MQFLLLTNFASLVESCIRLWSHWNLYSIIKTSNSVQRKKQKSKTTLGDHQLRSTKGWSLKKSLAGTPQAPKVQEILQSLGTKRGACQKEQLKQHPKQGSTENEEGKKKSGLEYGFSLNSSDEQIEIIVY